jgi:zinc D-Ala-D-Ala dipeptidase
MTTGEIAEFLRRHSRAVEVTSRAWCVPRNEYLRSGLRGARDPMLIREGVWLRLEEAARALPAGMRFVVYDALRTKETQHALFETMMAEVARRNAALGEAELVAETRKYCSHPEYSQEILPHNSGGAIDLGLVDGQGRELDLGTPFDDPSERSATEYFEREPEPGASGWMEARANRRLLRSAMLGAGFTNYELEWWHYDLGNGLWARRTGETAVYDSMEELALGRFSN